MAEFAATLGIYPGFLWIILQGGVTITLLIFTFELINVINRVRHESDD